MKKNHWRIRKQKQKLKMDWFKHYLDPRKCFYKKNPDDKIWWFDAKAACHEIGRLEISFDKKHLINLWCDYPDKLTKEQKEIFDKENPYWAKFLSGKNLDDEDKDERYASDEIENVQTDREVNRSE